MNGKLVGRRFLTRGSTRSGRAGLTINAPHGLLGRGALSPRRASRKLMRSTPRCWRLAACPMTRRPRLSTRAKTGRAFRPPSPVWPCHASIRSVVLRRAREVSTGQRWRDPRGEVGPTGDRCVEARRHPGDLAGPEPTRAAVVAHLSAPYGIGQGRRCLSGEPRGPGLRCQPRHRAVVEAERGEPAGPWAAVDGWGPPHPRPAKGPARGELHALARAAAAHRRHAGLDEAGEMGIGA